MPAPLVALCLSMGIAQASALHLPGLPPEQLSLGSAADEMGPEEELLASSGPRWTDIDKRARGTYTAGVVTGSVGLIITVAAVSNANLELASLGGLGIITGPALMAGGSMRSAKALRGMGRDVSRAAGTASWILWGGLWASSFGLVYSDPNAGNDGTWLLLYGASLLGSYGTAVAQNVANKRARSGTRFAGIEPAGRGLGVAPMVWTDDHARTGSGLVLSGRF